MPSFAQYHDELAQSVSHRKGDTLTAAQIRAIFRKAHPSLRADFVQPSDHCVDHTCKGACSCAGTAQAIFSRPARNQYVVL